MYASFLSAFLECHFFLFGMGFHSNAFLERKKYDDIVWRKMGSGIEGIIHTDVRPTDS